MSNELWSARKLSDLAIISSGASPPRTPGSIPVMGANGQIGSSNKSNFGPGYLVGRVGAAGAVNFVSKICWASDNTLTVVAQTKVCDSRFLGHWLRFLRPERLATKNAQPLVTQTNLGALGCEIPLRISEQQRIAEILDTLDETICKTEQLIAKLQQMKQGLLHDLLTRGIDENGQLRPLPEEAPELYQDSPLGKVPRDWKVALLGSFYRSPSRNGLYKPRNHHGSGPIMVQMGGIFKGFDVVLSRKSRVQVSPLELQTYGLRQGDLLFGRRSLVLEGAGKCSFVRDLPEPATFESSIVRVRVDSDRILPEFAALFLNSRNSYLQRRKFIRQVAVSGVSSIDIANFPLLCPPLAEQGHVLDAFSIVRKQLKRELLYVGKLRLLKQGLMDDLLSGRVRVSVPENNDN